MKLNAAFSVLRGTPVRSIEFYGITKTPLKYILEANSTPFLLLGTLFLVFKWAMKGSLLDHLHENLKGKPTDWDIILNFMEDLAASIEDLHSQNIIYR